MFTTTTMSSLYLTLYSSTHSLFISFSLMILPPPSSSLFPYTTLFRSPGPSPPNGHPQRDSSHGSEDRGAVRSEEHTSELQSPYDLVCRLLLEKKKAISMNYTTTIVLVHFTFIYSLLCVHYFLIYFLCL